MGRTVVMGEQGNRRRSAGTAMLLLAGGIFGLFILTQCDVTGLRSAVEKKVMPPAEPGAFAVIHSLLEVLPGETALDFGSYVVESETSTEEVFIIENNGRGVLTLSDATSKVLLGGADAANFLLSTQATATTIEPGKSTRFSVTFKPSTPGQKMATISIPHNAPGSPFQFALIGTGTTNPVAQINVKCGGVTVPSGSGSVSVGSINLNTTSPLKSVTIENLGSAQLNLTGDPKVAISGTDGAMFVIAQPQSWVPPHQSIDFSVYFTPASYGTKYATATIASNDPLKGSYAFSLSGVGVAPDIALYQGATLLGAAFDFGNGEITYGKSVGFVIKNPGTGILTLSGNPSVTVSGSNAAEFVVSQPAATTIAAGGSVSFSVQFNPLTVGSKSASLSIPSNVVGRSPLSLSLTGTGIVAPKIVVSPSEKVDFGKVYETLSGEVHQFTIQNKGSANLSLTGVPAVKVTTKYPGSFNVVAQPSVTTVAPNGSTTFSVVFSPTTLDLQDAELSIESNDSDATPYTLLAYGVGMPAPDINLTIEKVQIPSGSLYRITLPPATPAEVAVVIGNLGHATLVLKGSPTVSLTGDTKYFEIARCPPPGYELKPDTSVTCVANFLGSAAGTTRTATLTIPSNDPEKGESPYVVAVEVTVK